MLREHRWSLANLRLYRTFTDTYSSPASGKNPLTLLFTPL